MRILSILVFLFTYIGFCLAAEPKQSRPLNKKDWANLDQSVTTSSAIDDLIEHELKIHNKKKTTLCSDSDFYRRVALDLTGKLIHELSYSCEMEISSFANGLYLIKIETDAGVALKKLLISK